MASIENLSTKELKDILRRKEAQERMSVLEDSGIAQFRDAVANSTDLDSVYRLASSFVSKVNFARRMLGVPAKSKKGRKKKAE